MRYHPNWFFRFITWMFGRRTQQSTYRIIRSHSTRPTVPEIFLPKMVKGNYARCMSYPFQDYSRRNSSGVPAARRLALKRRNIRLHPRGA